MPAVSKKQQKFFGIVRAIQRGKMASTTPETAKVAVDMKKGDVKKFASTKHKGLPEKKKIEEDKQINKIIKQLRKSVKSHKKQADTLEKKVKTLKESDFTNITVGNKIGQTFQHATGATITLDNTMSDPSDLPSQVTLDLGFGDTITVDAPTTNEYGIAGITSSLGNAGGGGGVQTRQPTKSADEINQQLDASQEASGVDTAKVEEIKDAPKYSETEIATEMKTVNSLMSSMDQYGNVKDQKVLKSASEYNIKLKNNQAELNKRVKEIEEYRVKQSEWEKKSAKEGKIISSRRKANISKVRSFLSKYGEKLPDSITVDSHKEGLGSIRIVEGGKKLLVISHDGFNYGNSNKFNVRVYEADQGKRIGMTKGQFKFSGESILGNIYSPSTGGSGIADTMYTNIGNQIENKSFEIKEIEPTPMPEIPPYLMKNKTLGWYNAPLNLTDNTKNKIMTGDFARNVLGAIGSVLSSIPGTDRQGYEGDIEYAAKLTKDMMDGNLTVDKGPQSKSFNKRLLDLISKNPDRNYVSERDYDNDKINAIKELPVRLAIQSFNWNATKEGILVDDKFDFDINISGGALAGLPLVGETIQKGIKVISDAMRMRSVELGFNQVENLDGVYSNMASPEFSAPAEVTQGGQGGKPLGSTTQRGGKIDPFIKAALASNTSPDGFYKDIKILIPWSQVAKDAPQLMSKKPTGSSVIKKTSSTDSSSTDSDVFDRDDASFKKKKKEKVNESKLSFELIQQFREESNPAQQAAIAISMKKKGIKPKNLKEQIQFAQMQQRIRDAKEKRREQQKKSEKLYIDTRKKGVKFYDKKGSGRLKDGKKIYD